MTGKRTKYTGEFKAKVALEAIKGEMTLAQLSSKHGVHQTLITSGKKQAIENLSAAFSGKAEQAKEDREVQVEKLHAKIGELLVERDFLRKASGR